MTATKPKAMRCAVYTRKSVDEGLDQEVNSLTVQREAGEAYIASQKSEGWMCLPELFDDGGFTGANMQRPALKRLLAKIEAGEIDCVVVYKVDRLSRSLLDFAKLSDVFTRHEVAFVSVTQQINTGTSMGKLMLGILISFAQFERETIAERTRDRMAAARRKGRWVGGRPFLGYDANPETRQLEVNQVEAQQVEDIFQTYLECRSLSATMAALNERGLRMKSWVTRKGEPTGGGRFTKSSLHGLLKNRAYIGEIVYRDEVIPAMHEAVISRERFEEAQSLLQENDLTQGHRSRNKHAALLRGLLHCRHCGTAMSHSFTRKKSGKVYRYYVCQRAMKESWAVCPSKSVSAGEIEAFVVAQIKRLGSDAKLQDAVARRLLDHQAQRRGELRKREKKVRAQHTGLLRRELKFVRQEAGAAELAHLQENLRKTAVMLEEIQHERRELDAQQLSRTDIALALSLFDPVWAKLCSDERCALIANLIASIAYDGENEQIEITWKEAGFHALKCA